MLKTFLTIGLFCLLTQISVSPVLAKNFTHQPNHIIVPTAQIDLPVFEAPIVLDTWQVRFDGASFGQGSTLPGNEGNTIIFSHAQNHLFGKLPQVKTGDLIHVFTALDWFVYEVETVEVITPEKIDKIFKSKGKTLTLYTCVGDDYEERFIVTAHLLYSK